MSSFGKLRGCCGNLVRRRSSTLPHVVLTQENAFPCPPSARKKVERRCTSRSFLLRFLQVPVDDLSTARRRAAGGLVAVE
jgi:hypothetical protein